MPVSPPPRRPAATGPAPPSAPGPEPAAPRAGWRRLIAWLAQALWRLARGAAQHLGRAARTVWGRVRDAELSPGRRVAWALGGLAGAGAVAGALVLAGVLLFALALWPLTPSVRSLERAQEPTPSRVLSADGAELTRFERPGRDWVALADVAPAVVDALLATEDRRFYDHGGMDLRRTAGAALRTLGGDPQGGSTLTQQLARNLFPDQIGRARNVTRKLKEAVTAFKIERVYTKDEILELYLNTVPFLYNAVGIERAARTYFSVSADELTTVQAATLVGMLKGTSSYNPKQQPERALARRNVVLQQLAVTGRATQAEVDVWQGAPLGLRFERLPLRSSRAPHFTEHVRSVAERWADDAGYNLYGDGLVVHTTLDWRLQEAANESVARFGDALQAVADVEWARASAARLGPTTVPYVTASRSVEPFERFWTLRASAADAFVRDTPRFQRAVAAGQDPAGALAALKGDRAFRDSLRAVKMRLEVAFTAVDPATGGVRAWVGSRSYARSAYDHVARARRQPGSTFKPFLYARALEEGWAPTDSLPDTPVSFEIDGETWSPQNAGDRSSGRNVALRDALAQSTNTVAARLGADVGARDVARTARRLGIQSDLRAVPSLPLGTSEVSLLELTAAYATIAAGGVRRPPVVISRIEAADGTVLATFAPEPEQALDPEVAVQLTDMLRGVVDGGSGSDLRRRFDARGDLAGKTGTSQDGADGWFELMHPDLVLGAWVGFDDPRVTFRSDYWGQGGHNALRVVGDVARTARRRGLLSAERRFPDPPAPDAREGWLDRVGGWLGGVIDAAIDRQREQRERREDREAVPRRRPAPEARPGRTRASRPPIDPRILDDPEAARQAIRRAAEELGLDPDAWEDRVRDAGGAAEREVQREIERAADRAARDAAAQARRATRDVADEARRAGQDAAAEAREATRRAADEAREEIRRQAEAARRNVERDGRIGW